MQIPRVIHYCWFVGNPLPEEAQRCIDSWKKICPDYQIRRWDETNYDINCCPYVQEAYQQKKWAFVSDYARYDILNTYGGIYLDTDVELIRPIEDILGKGSFMGMERQASDKAVAVVAPGLGMGMTANHPFCREVLSQYSQIHFLNQDGSCNQTTIVKYTTDLLKRHGLKDSDDIQCVAGIWIYPWDYFCPMGFETGELHITENTRSIHHYASSWFTEEEKKVHLFTIRMTKRFGPFAGQKLGRMYSFPYLVKRKVQRLGFWGALQFSVVKIKQHFIGTKYRE